MEEREIYFGHGVVQMFLCWHFHMERSFWDLEFLFGKQRLPLF
jgi:hypothetical protein